MMAIEENLPPPTPPRAPIRRQVVFFIVVTGLILAAVLRSSLATRLDGFTMDEAYHITAGVSYWRTGDYRLNPEHPPLVKLWVGAALSGGVFRLPEFRPLQDKTDERTFTDTAVFLENDPDPVQSRVRIAMLSFSALLLFCFALAARRALGSKLALCALAFLAIDPTVAAHMPVVMTDLAVALLSVTALLWAVVAFQTWKFRDLLLATLFLGLTLAAKHSGLITLAAVALLGAVLANFSRSAKDPQSSGARVVLRRKGMVAAVLAGALILLWGFYRFRFDESPRGRDVFNRPLAEKIGDLRSSTFKAALQVMSKGHLMPRAYVWGLADTVRAGIEGRVDNLFAFGRQHYDRVPVYFFPGVLLVKLPLGLIALSAIGLFLLVSGKLERERLIPLAGAAALAALFLLALGSGKAYGGIRHALPLVPLLALFGGTALSKAIETKSPPLRGLAALALVAALVSAIPVLRPWEYYNELIGGGANAYRYFNDEGVDLAQRRLELVQYYNEVLKPSGERPYISYNVNRQEMQRREIHWMGESPRDFDALEASDTVTATFLVGAVHLAPAAYWDKAALRKVQPAARFGNLFVFRGTFPAGWVKGPKLFYRALELLYGPQPDEAKAEKLLVESMESDPTAFFVALELGNRRAKHGLRDEAIRAYEVARTNAPPGNRIIELLTRQIERVSKEPPESVPPLRNPFFE